ncbi:MAG: Adenosine deaminase [Acidimicrobiales bacterium]|nr:Adenosine deaminase [Acidimicrobiales bacterium]
MDDGSPDRTAPPDVAALARRLPKVELHCHLEGSARPETIAELARNNGVVLPVEDPRELFEFHDLNSFIAVYEIICRSLRTAEDFRRLTYEALDDGAAAGVRYREMFFSPGFVIGMGVPIEVVWEGIVAGLREAETDLDIRCRMILDIDKPSGPAPAEALVRFAGTQDRDVLIGVGGDSTERDIDHRAFAEAFALAGRLGLRRTVHAGEDGPAENVAIALDVLGCERIDHGVRVLEDPELTARVAAAQVPLTVCPISNVVIANLCADVASHPFGALRAAGILATVNSDDPGMQGTTIADDYAQVAAGFGYDLTTMETIALDGIGASWAPADEKDALRKRFLAEFDELRSEAGLALRHEPT